MFQLETCLGLSVSDVFVYARIHSQGASAEWWNHRHFQHHAKPNVFKKDPDVNMLNAFVVGKVQPVEVRTPSA